MASHTFTVSIVARRRQPFAVRAKRHAIDPNAVSFQRERLLTGRGVPHLHRLIIAAVASRFPSGLNATLQNTAVCPFNVSVSWPVVASHTFTV